MDVAEHETLSNFIPRHKLKYMNSSYIAVLYLALADRVLNNEHDPFSTMRVKLQIFCHLRTVDERLF
jgi:hypothetical protein